MDKNTNNVNNVNNLNNVNNVNNVNNIIEHCKSIKEIGKGNYGKVYLISLKRASAWCKYYCNFCHKYYKKKEIAIKETPTKEDTTENDIIQEYKCHKYCSDNNSELFINITDFWIEKGIKGLINDYPSPRTNGYFIIEYMNFINLNHFLTSENDIEKEYRIRFPLVNGIFLIIYIIYYLHNVLNMCHGDISWDNIFISYQNSNTKVHLQNYNNKFINLRGFTIKIGDFGISERIKDDLSNNLIKRDYIIFDHLKINYSSWKNIVSFDKSKKILDYMNNYILSYIDNGVLDLNVENNYFKLWNILNSNQSDTDIYFHKLPEIMLKEYLNKFNVFE